MCPLCDRVCGYWKLATACGTARASHLFDNPATVFFSVFMSLWGKIQRKCWSNLTSHIKQTITVGYPFVTAPSHSHTMLFQ